MMNTSDSSHDSVVTAFFENLGFTSEERKLYTALAERGPLTALELSRISQVNRTKVYRLLEKLKKQGLIEEIIDENRLLAKAVGPNQLQLLVHRQEEKTKFLTQAFPMVSSLFADRNIGNTDTRVQFYRGKNGIQQMGWNTLEADELMRGYTYRRYDEIVGSEFDRKWTEEWVKRGLVLKDLYSDRYLASHTISGQPARQDTANFQSRYISSTTLDINHQMDIYNNVIAIYTWYEGDVVGVEIYNQKMADMQKQLFDIVWGMSNPSVV